MSLMTASTQSYGDLTAQYGQFLAPACQIKVDGKPLPQTIGVGQVIVSLSLDAASTVTFSVEGAYKPQNTAFDSSVKNIFKLGAKVVVSLGYGSDLLEIFQGFIFGVGVSFGDSPTMNITAMDLRRLMMEGTAREEKHVVTTYSGAFEAVMERYSSVCTAKEVTATDSDEIASIVQRVSDYAFVKEVLANKANREFFVLGDTAYFREKAANKTPCVKLNWGEGLLNFSRNSLYQNIKITVLGFDSDNKEAISADVTAKAGESQTQVVSPNETILVDSDAKEVAKAKKRAEKEAADRKAKAQSGSGSSVGLPEIVPGRFITLGQLDDDLNGDYYITEVNHTFGNDGFTTDFQIGGWT
ncbi:MAG: hypothetical protein R3Y62_01055 [Eubacteriales bacterium]